MDTIWTHLTTVAPWPIWALGVGQTVLLAVAVVVAIRQAAKRRRAARQSAGDPAKDPASNPATDGRLARTLLIAAMAFCAVVLAAFVIGTYEGSTAFARTYLGWTNWRQIIPWGALDAAGFGFGLFVIRAVVKDRSPIRPRRVVYLCAGFSSLLQMIQGGQDHRWQAGLFLAFIAAMGAMVLHTVVDQLRDETDEAAWHRSPPFGVRWLTWPTNTLCAWLAWINHPAQAGANPTVVNALSNLERVRSDKAARLADRFTEDLTFPRLSAIIPGRRAKVYATAITTVRTEHEQKISDLAGRADATAVDLDATRADLTAQINTLRAQIDNLTADRTAQAQRAQALTADLERVRADAAQAARAAAQAAAAQTEQAVRAELQQEINDLRGQVQRAAQTPTPARPAQAAKQAKPAQQVTDLHTDEQIAEALWGEYCAQMEKSAQPLTRYRVEQAGGCKSRQAERVLALLARRWSAQAEQTLRAQDRADATAQNAGDDPAPLDRDPQPTAVGA